MNDAEQAAALADNIETSVAGAIDDEVYHGWAEIELNEAAWKLIVRALRRLAETDGDAADMATVGRSLMNAIAVHQETPGDPLFDWAPADNPAEVVGDLVEMVLVARAEQSTQAPPLAGLREVVAKAFEECEIGFSLHLIRLVDGVSTYLLSTTDGEPDAEFEDQEDAYAELGRRKAKARSDAVLSAISARGLVILPREPTKAMGDAGAESHTMISWGMAGDCYRAMVGAALAAKDDP